MQFKKTILSLIFTASLLAPLAQSQAQSASAPPPIDGHQVAMIFDQSGSMTRSVDINFNQGAGLETMSSFDAIKRAAMLWLDQVPSDNSSSSPPVVVNTQIAVYTLHGSVLTKILDYTTDRSQVSVTIGELTALPTGSTPLAMALCDVSDELVAVAGADALARRHIWLGTDGEENTTPSTHECSGTTDEINEYPNFDVNSWQDRVRRKLLLGDLSAADTDVDSSLVTMNVDWIFASFADYLNIASPPAPWFTFAASVHPKHQFSSLTPARKKRSKRRRQMSLFEGLALETKGTLTLIAPTAHGAPIDASAVGQRARGVLGDVDGSGCTDDDDFDALFDQFGKKAASSPKADKADLNRDGIVDIKDYRIVLSNLGKGPGC